MVGAAGHGRMWVTARKRSVGDRRSFSCQRQPAQDVALGEIRRAQAEWIGHLLRPKTPQFLSLLSSSFALSHPAPSRRRRRPMFLGHWCNVWTTNVLLRSHCGFTHGLPHAGPV